MIPQHPALVVHAVLGLRASDRGVFALRLPYQIPNSALPQAGRYITKLAAIHGLAACINQQELVSIREFETIQPPQPRFQSRNSRLLQTPSGAVPRARLSIFGSGIAASSRVLYVRHSLDACISRGRKKLTVCRLGAVVPPEQLPPESKSVCCLGSRVCYNYRHVQ